MSTTGHQKSFVSRKRIQPNFLGPATTTTTSTTPQEESVVDSAQSEQAIKQQIVVVESSVATVDDIKLSQPITSHTAAVVVVQPAAPTPAPEDLKTKQSLDLLQSVRSRFGDQSPVFHEFIRLLQGFHSNSHTPEYIVNNIRTLFKDHQDLLIGFDLVVGSPITTSTTPTTQPTVVQQSSPTTITTAPLPLPLPTTTVTSTTTSAAVIKPVKYDDVATTPLVSSTITKPPPSLPIPASLETKPLVPVVATPSKSQTSFFPKTDALLSSSVIETSTELPDITTNVTELKRHTTDETLHRLLNKLEIQPIDESTSNNNGNNNSGHLPLTTDDLITPEPRSPRSGSDGPQVVAVVVEEESTEDEEESDEDEDEEEEEEGSSSTTNKAGYQQDEVALSDEGEQIEDPDPVDFNPDDLNDQKRMTEIHELIRQRNTRQRYQREQKLNDMFDRITKGAPPPYITPTKFEKRRKKKYPEDQDEDDEVEVSESDTSLSSSLNDSVNLLSLNPLAPILEGQSLNITTSTTTTTSSSSSSSFVTPRKSEKRKDPPPQSPFALPPSLNKSSLESQSSLSISNGSIGETVVFKKLFSNSNSIHKKMREKMTAVAILNAKELLKHEKESNINIILISLMRLSLFAPSIESNAPKGTEKDKFQQLLNSENGLSNQFLKWKATDVIKSYQSVSTDQWLSATAHTKKKLVHVHLMNQIIVPLFGVPTKILAALADIPSSFTSQSTGIDTLEKIITRMTEQKKLTTPEEIQLFKSTLVKVYSILSSPPPPNHLLTRFTSTEIQSIINNRSEVSGKLKTIVKSHDPPKQPQPQQQIQKPQPQLQQPQVIVQQGQPQSVNSQPQPTTTTVLPPQKTAVAAQPLEQPQQKAMTRPDTSAFQTTTNTTQQPPVIIPAPQSQPPPPPPTIQPQVQPQPIIPPQTTTTTTGPQQQQQNNKKSSAVGSINTNEFMQSTEKSLQELTTDQAKIQYLLQLVSKQQAQIQLTQNENQKLSTQNQMLYENIDRFAVWQRNVKTQYEQYASFMSHSMMFSLNNPKK
ncbi:hypothetical protein DFA_03293 [Cavenderia fasciculata]|uniref:Uncharacterized protein n=1 Tax=Cavenderia fasciculata TaxID=261658 RepID=F4PH63_CACFS|nr:uncharacterized protein DFA_03293 [Cavenderia fasciculata]EGG25047.1 hypothetical protein DFA_03293 [Cavenderia fasciculata]|eukprot:XP_004362898.1 hypothetical protein DFA_03293 [Cavenderia fasciculata]